MPSLKLGRSIFYGWWVLIACAAIQFYVGGTYFQGFTALFNPIADEFGWSYALISLAFTFRGFEAGIIGPIAGIFADRFGPRRLLLLGIIITGLGFLFFSGIHALWSYYTIFFVLALGLSLASGVVTMTAVAGWFKTRRSLAMGILTSGFGASGLMVPAVVWLVDEFGWRETMVMFAVGAGFLGVPLASIVKDPPVEQHSVQKKESSSEVEPKLTGMTPKEVLKTKNFWILSMAILFGGLAGSAIIVHQIPYLVSVGISRQTAGFLVIVLSLSSIAGRLLFGWLGDVLDKRHCFAIGTAIKAGGVFAFAMASTVGQFIPTMIVVGIGWGGLIPLRPGLQVEFFGMRAFGTIQGLLMVFITLGTIISPVFAGWMFDLVNDYRPAFFTLAGATLIAIPMVLFLRGGLLPRFAMPQQAR